MMYLTWDSCVGNCSLAGSFSFGLVGWVGRLAQVGLFPQGLGRLSIDPISVYRLTGLTVWESLCAAGLRRCEHVSTESTTVTLYYLDPFLNFKRIN